MIFYDLPVSSATYSAEEFRKRFRYVTNELRKVVTEHNELRMCGRHINYSCHMIGDSRDTALPSILIECRERDLKMLRELFNKYATTLCCRKDSTWPMLVHHDLPSSKSSFQLVYLSHAYHPIIQHAANTPLPVSNSSSDTFCGALVQYEGRIATIGLTFIVDGINQEKQNLDFGHSSIPESPSQESLNASYTNDGSQSCLAECPVGQPIPLPHPLDPPAPYLDWAFVELNSSSASFQLPNIITLDSTSSPLLLRQVAKHPLSHTTSVYMISGINGTRKGCLFGGLNSDQGLEPGECGSIIVDRTTFDIYGHVIGSNIIGDVFVVPLSDSIEQIRAAFNATTVTLPSQNLILPLCNLSEDTMTTQARLYPNKLHSAAAHTHIHSGAAKRSLGSSPLAQMWRRPEDPRSHSGQFRRFQTPFYPDEEDTSLLKTLNEAGAGVLDDEVEVPTLLFCHPYTRFTERSIERIQDFCCGASFALDKFVSLPQSSGPYASSDARVVDSSLEIPYYAVVTDPQAKRDIEREDGASIMALIRTMSCRQVAILRPMIMSYVTTKINPCIQINETQWWGSRQHHLRFQFPFFTLISEGYNDPRTVSKTGEPFRTRLSFSFLAESHSGSLFPQDSQASLCESVISFGIAVHSIGYWDVYCFEDGDTSISIFGFDFEDDEFGSKSDFQTPGEMLRHSPRTFFLHTMTLSLDRVLDQHALILEVFQDFVKRQARYLSKSAKQRNEFTDNSHRLKEVLRQVLNSITVLTCNVQEFLSNDPRKDLEDVPNGGDFADGTRLPTTGGEIDFDKFYAGRASEDTS
ncbi:RNA-binding protein [Fusarium subglutinans]|uniref:RNA-binding protein n=1 Tax=Gibberella subglutinans TaxID=42677 RepID=A0A8H5KMT0_GIBSU|nr:RNA-binding protein [Fusarium subglutinans]KAF5574775.1 RNA-binding protein [Fusarium subglutinans]